MEVYSKSQAKEKIESLVDHYGREKSKIHSSGETNEAQIEDKYIKPLFAYLNWNIHNEGLPIGREEFIVQYKHRSTKRKTRPDYLLRLYDEQMKKSKKLLFIEAKHPTIDLKNNLSAIRQAYQYAHSTLNYSEKPENRVRLALLTDFEEFRLFDCIDPNPMRKNVVAQFNKNIVNPFEWTCANYVTDFNILWDVFERNNVQKGSLNSLKLSHDDLIKNRQTPDIQFLNDLQSWRLAIARNLFKHDADISEELLTAATQLILNRLIFIKALSDKDIEPDLLAEILAKVSVDKKINLFAECETLFEKLDVTYNGSIFRHRPELDNIEIDNDVLKSIIEALKPENSIYNLAAMPVEIIGNTYESFLAMVIKRKGRGLTLEEKPGVRKGQGVYYTPRNIVDYIVDKTLGPKLALAKNPSEIESLKIIDIACGSGSFLIAAFEKLLDYYKDYFLKQALINLKKGNNLVNEQYKDGVRISFTDETKKSMIIRLTAKLKQEILKNNIFGVDIDNQAVEVARFSLSLKCIEDTEREEILEDYGFFHTAVLPDLKSNIRCGNSIEDPKISKVIRDQFQKLTGFEQDDYDRTMERINPFDWEYNFKDIFRTGKFDVIIGNPPWVSLSGKFRNDVLSEEEINFLIEKYAKYNRNTYMPNLYEFFISQGIELLKEDGVFSLIVPDRFGFNNQFKDFRKNILENLTIKELAYKADFPGVTADTLIFVVLNTKNETYDISAGEFERNMISKTKAEYLDSEGCIFSYETSKEVSAVLKKLYQNPKLVQIKEIMELTSGFGGKSSLLTTKKTSSKQREVLKGENIRRYKITGSFYFEFTRDNITGRTTDQSKLGAVPKILMPKTGYPLYAAFDDSGRFPEQSAYFFFNNTSSYDYRFILVLLNSSLFSFIYWNKLVTNKDSTPQLKKDQLEQFLVPKLDLTNPEDIQIHQKLVENAIELERLTAKRHEPNLIEKQQNAYDAQIANLEAENENLVNGLYQMTQADSEVIKSSI